VAVLKSAWERLRDYPIFESEREAYPQTFSEELNDQCGRILFVVCLITTVAWLPYIYLDAGLHPEEPLLPVIRMGLSVLSLTLFILHVSKRFPRHNMLFLVLIGAYLAVGCGLITALADADPAYMGGYIFILTVMALVPVDRRYAIIIIAASLLTFFVTGRFENISFDRTSDRYSVLDLSSATVVAIAFIYLLHNTRLASWLKSRKIEQQSEEMRSDKEKIDNLLLNILPPAVAEELKGQGYVKPVFYPSATIVFTDFVGFTKISETLTPDQLVRELDSAFSRFDRVMDKYGLEKLKTIGDSYMYAGGVPLPNATHAIDAVLGALEIQSFVEQINLEKSQSGRPVFEIRIGINSGPLMAGVVGEKKFVYDVWGDSVNLASRMESSGGKGRINISESTHARIRDYFETEARGQVLAKNKGAVSMYFVNRLKKEFASDPEGRTPSESFWSIYKKLQEENTAA